MAKITKPELVQRFEHMLWINSPKHWIFKSTYYRKTLFISILIETPIPDQYKKIRRSFTANVLNDRIGDIWGLAADCIDEMRANE